MKLMMRCFGFISISSYCLDSIISQLIKSLPYSTSPSFSTEILSPFNSSFSYTNTDTRFSLSNFHILEEEYIFDVT